MPKPMQLAPGTDASKCPRCGGPMSSPSRGRQSSTNHLWFRHCLDRERCNITSVTTDAPANVVDTTPAAVYMPASLPFGGPQ